MAGKIRKIEARYAGSCTKCGEGIAVGSEIAWAPSVKASHWACHSAPAIETGKVSYESPYHPESAEAVNAMEECEEFEALEAWYAAFEKPSATATYASYATAEPYAW